MYLNKIDKFCLVLMVLFSFIIGYFGHKETKYSTLEISLLAFILFFLGSGIWLHIFNKNK